LRTPHSRQRSDRPNIFRLSRRSCCSPVPGLANDHEAQHRHSWPASSCTSGTALLSAMPGVFCGMSRRSHGAPVRCRRPCRRRGCSSGGGRGSCGPGRSASWCAGRRAGRRSGHPASPRPHPAWL